MGYVEKKVLIEALKIDNRFSDADVSLFEKFITADKIFDNEAVMDSNALSQIEVNGLRNKFLSFCDEKNWFQDWVHNAKHGID